MILLVNGKPGSAGPWAEYIRKAGYEVSESSGDLRSDFRRYKPSAAFLSPAGDSRLLETLQELKVLEPELPVVVASDAPELFATASCGPFGRVRCVPPRSSSLAVASALAEGLKAADPWGPELQYPAIIGMSRAIKEIRRKIAMVAEKDVAVLVTGESGTGKELISRAIHCHSLRRKKPLVKINCGALPDSLLESEVFGYQKGAFTGAYSDKPGRLELADGGTLFIDEIGDLSLALQVKFLQVLEEKVFSRLGGTLDKEVDTRVIAATNSDLSARVESGEFRKDLYYRLGVMHIKAPPLRDRREDIPLLTRYFLFKYSIELARPPLDIPKQAMDHLVSYHWPGNVRELENVIRRAVVMRDWSFLSNEIPLTEPASPSCDLDPWSEEAIAAHLQNGTLKTLVKAYTSEIEREAIEKTLASVRWNRKQAARLLGVSYKTLLNRIADLNLADS
ncbi:MAG: sigma-54 interaction domain-containing protein [Desulfobacteraceae bacterium]